MAGRGGLKISTLRRVFARCYWLDDPDVLDLLESFSGRVWPVRHLKRRSDTRAGFLHLPRLIGGDFEVGPGRRAVAPAYQVSPLVSAGLRMFSACWCPCARLPQVVELLPREEMLVCTRVSTAAWSKSPVSVTRACGSFDAPRYPSPD